MDVVLVLIMFIYFLLSMFDYLLNSKLDLIHSYGYIIQMISMLSFDDVYVFAVDKG